MQMEKLCDRYLAEYALGKKSCANEKWMIDKYIRTNPHLKLPLDKIDYEHIQKIHKSFGAKKHLANRVLSLLSIMFTLAERWKLRPRGTNPCVGVQRHQENKRHRYLDDAEICRLIAAAEWQFERNPIQAAAILLLLYTGARCGEILSARWNQIQGSEIHLPDSKTGQCIIFLTPQAMEVLARLPRVGYYIFGPETRLRTVWAKILQRAGINDFRLHDLRHAFASVGISANLTLGKIGPLLRHSSPETTQRYSHLVPSEGRAAAMAIGQRFTAITGANHVE